ncbi:MAG: hypothetical protein GXO65_03770 [Euryarchaeota archaeon]|nr:hypothetical protein [Euryarchaeota archaeon]
MEIISRLLREVNPFQREAADTVFQISEGKPRTIAQVTKLAFNHKAVELSRGQSDGDLSITSKHILQALKEQLGD